MCTWTRVQTTNKQKFHMSYYIVKTDFEAHHQEREVQTQNVEKAENLNTYIGTKSCKVTRKASAMLCYS